jgi:O-antigen/teichoic acid export membrane protein
VSAARLWKTAAVAWKDIIRFSFYLNVTSTFRYLTKNLDVLILGKIVPLESVGAYGLARRISNLFAYFTDPLLIVIYPEMVRDWAARQFGKVKKLFVTVSAAATAAITVLYLILCFSAPVFIPKIFGKDFSRSEILLWLFFPAAIFSVGFFMLYHLLLTMNATRELFWASLIQLIAMIVLVPLLTLTLKEMGTAVAMSTAIVLSYLYSLAVARRYFRSQPASIS